jgi:ribosomal protein S6E (S10)
MKNETDREVLSKDAADALRMATEAYASRFFNVDNLKAIGKPINGKIVDLVFEQLKANIVGGKKIEASKRLILTIEGATGKRVDVIVGPKNKRALDAVWGDDAKKWLGAMVTIRLVKQSNGQDMKRVEPTEEGAK